jgi:hypothetical protein
MSATPSASSDPTAGRAAETVRIGAAASGPPPTAAPMNPDDERTWAILTHLSPLLGYVTGVFFLAPVVVHLVLRHRGPFIRHHTAESLNALISFGIYWAVSWVVGGVGALFTFGLSLALPIAVAVVAAIFWIIAAVEANRGRWYRYPMIIRFVR